MLNMFDKYEELNLANYVDGKEDRMVFGNTQATETSSAVIKESMSKLCENLKNPYFNLYHWCKGELFDIQAIEVALKKKDDIYSKIGRNEKSKKTTQGDLDNLTQGRSTIKQMVMRSDANTMVNKIENVSKILCNVIVLIFLYPFMQADKEIEALNKLHDILTIYLGEEVVPAFKGRKIKIYQKIVQQFNVMQINNAH